MFDTMFGLPTHVMVVHLAVVAVPVASLASLLVAVRRPWLLRAGWWVVGLDALAVVTAYLAGLSGEELLDRLDAFSAGGPRPEAIQTHVDRGGDMVWYALALFAVTLALLLVARHRAVARFRRRTIPPVVVPVLAVLTIAAAVLATVQVVRVGHSGSSAVWRDIVKSGDTAAAAPFGPAGGPEAARG